MLLLLSYYSYYCYYFLSLLFYCYTIYVTENKHINVSLYAKYDIANVVGRKKDLQ